MFERIKRNEKSHTFTFGEKLAKGLSAAGKKNENIFSPKLNENQTLTKAYKEYVFVENSFETNFDELEKLANVFSFEFLTEDVKDDGKINFSILSPKAKTEMEAGRDNIFNSQPRVEYNLSNNPQKNELIGDIIGNIDDYDLRDNNAADGSIYSDEELSEFIESLDIADDGKRNGSVLLMLDRIKNPRNEEDRQNAIEQIKNTIRIMIDKNYDALTLDKPEDARTPEKIQKKPAGISNEKFQNLKISKDKPNFINEADWGKIKKLDPQMQAAITELYKRADAQGIKFNINSGLRSNEEQKQLAATARAGYAAKPGTSQHEFGRAVDVSATKEDKKKLGDIWQKMGFKWGNTFSKAPEDWHFDIRTA